MSDHNQLPTDPDKRRTAVLERARWIERMTTQDPRHAALFCPTHVNYIGHGGVFPCHDCHNPTSEGASQ